MALRTFFAWLKTQRIHAGLLIAIFGISLWYAFHFKIFPVVDAQAYDQIAINIAQGHGFRENLSVDVTFDPSIIRAGPGYEFFLAFFYVLFGHHYQVIWVVQACLHTASAWLLYRLCRKLFTMQGDRIGLLAMALFGLSPDLIEIGAMLMTETLYLFFIILTLYFFVVILEEPTHYWLAAAAGFVTGLAVLTRPTVVLFVPIIVFFYWRKGLLRQGIFYLVLFCSILVPWAVRNYLIYHQLILTTMIGEYNLWVGNTLNSNGGQISGGFNPLTTYTAANGFLLLPKIAHAAFWSFVREHFGLFLKLCAIRIVRYLSLIRPMGFWFYQHGISQLIFVTLSGLWIGLTFVTGYSGLALLGAVKDERYYYWIALAATSPLLLIPTVVESRYRFPIYPFLVVAGAYALAWIPQTKGWWKQKAVYIPVAALLFMTLVDMTGSIAKIAEHIVRML